MSQFDKAVDFYLRGFNGQYIKRRTGISIQSLLKQLLSNGVRYTKSDIVEYQIKYIRNKFSADDIKAAYIEISRKHADLYKASKGKHIECLGCGFGDYPKVFRALLGEDAYRQLSAQCWHEKQSSVIMEKYGVDNVFCKEAFEKVVDKDAVAEGRKKRIATLMERYGVTAPNADHEIAARMQKTLRETNIERYGVASAMQVPDIAKKASLHRQDTMTERYGAANSTQVPAIRDKIFASRKSNGTLNTSKPEDALYAMLVERFGKDDVARNFFDKRYPWHVDFYIKSLDLFIELNGDKCHNTHWYDEDSVSDRQTVEAWIENMVRLEAETGKQSRYRKYIETWTIKDVSKRNTAAENRLHYLVFWDGSNKGGVPRLKDAREWFTAGCPMPECWHKENTY